MKKRVLLLITILLVMAPFFVFAESDIKVEVDGVNIQFNKETGIPFIDENGRIQVPVSVVLKKCGISVDWDAQNRLVLTEKDGVKVEIPIDKNYITKNHQQIKSDTVAKIKNGRTYLPIRKVMESYGADVKWYANAKTVSIYTTKNSNIVKFNVPSELGMPKLTKEEVEELIGADPKIIQQKISTVYDLIQYMESSNYKNISGDTKVVDKDYVWSFNKPALITINDNKGNCGATSNLANYILKDDYDEIGFIHFSADSGQGGHVFNYIKQNNKYYIIDFLKYPMGDYKGFADILIFDNLEDFPKECIIRYSDRGRLFQIKIIVAFKSDNQIPLAYRKNEYIGKFFPIEEKENIKILYETPSEGKIVEFIDGPKTQPIKWN